jgi:hypothetical protein
MKFNELDERTQEKVLEKYSDINTDYDWWDSTYEYWKPKLENLGVSNPTINFSGFWSQGDGASFTGQLDIIEFLTATKKISKFRYLVDHVRDNNLWLDCNIYRNDSHYVHENTCRVGIDEHIYVDNEKSYDLIVKRVKELEEYLEEWRLDTCHEIYKDLETEYEYQTGKEQIIESLEANEYEFDEDGDII